ncbi:4-hydroxy-tetrahydrodipicolinate synthase [Rhizobium sp. Root1203]|uniref:4-hydroxy-tetrahydrodipicolinate synthase n=1 Tax=Rhizobium sp. Root1203 TaxID=1736427 RepID=UPI00070ACE05|nr:4-hydroxy-tetrahydrodipicolinate synthase [Rhizobium sp. Root1203]KQV31701.1 4-hydroxy-tetrahydrodipicolinate synthase [Rhizobium sp. Root1203]
MRTHISLRLGTITTALITPFRGDRPDLAALEQLAERQIRSGIDGLAVCTVTGEGPTLSMEEQAEVVRTCVRVAAGRVPIIAATGTNSTSSTIALTRQAENLGASAALVTAPYYSKPLQRGVVHHFQMLAAETTLPLIVDSNQSRCAISLSRETLEAFSCIPSIVALVGVLDTDICSVDLPRHLRDRFTFLSNRDDTARAFLGQRGDGIISAGANIHPRLFASMQQAARAGNVHAALALEGRLLPLVQALGADGDPSAVKHALHVLLGTDPSVRLPMVALAPDEKTSVFDALTLVSDLRSKSLPL